ncbi:MAG: exodeoxyribonuclease VII large subunit [Ruminococcaceae bacterium]|nr:exodeoxyribonuclease VII large subunit [Oscillospiraceae bacterium]
MYTNSERRQEYCISVTQLNEYIKTILEGNAFLSNVCLRGEISNFTNHRSGHFYFSMKDENSLIRAVMFRSAASRLKFMPENGMKVLLRGSVSLFVRDGQYQIYVTSMEPDGIGSLYLAFEQLKQKLSKEHLFDEDRKKPIPAFPSCIGVITSPTGAAVRDIINILGRRFPLAEIVLYPSLVQGNDAPAQLIQGIKHFNGKSSADVIIIGRGGGSIEDLWAFNDEGLAYAISESEIPVISAVGHETDFTICDFVSDLRAPTPSAAAELAVPDIIDFKREINNSLSYMSAALTRKISSEKQKLELLKNRRLFGDPEFYLQDKKMLVTFLNDKLSGLITSKTSECKQKLASIAGKMDAMSPLSTLSRGYSIGYNLTKENPLQSINDAAVGDEVEFRLKDGSLLTKVFNKK